MNVKVTTNKSSWTKIGRRTASTGCCEVRKSRQGSGRRSVHTDDNVVTVQSLLLSHEDKSQSHRTVSEISREAWIRRSSVWRIIS